MRPIERLFLWHTHNWHAHGTRTIGHGTKKEKVVYGTGANCLVAAQCAKIFPASIPCCYQRTRYSRRSLRKPDKIANRMRRAPRFKGPAPLSLKPRAATPHRSTRLYPRAFSASEGVEPVVKIGDGGQYCDGHHNEADGWPVPGRPLSVWTDHLVPSLRCSLVGKECHSPVLSAVLVKARREDLRGFESKVVKGRMPADTSYQNAMLTLSTRGR